MYMVGWLVNRSGNKLLLKVCDNEEEEVVTAMQLKIDGESIFESKNVRILN